MRKILCLTCVLSAALLEGCTWNNVQTVDNLQPILDSADVTGTFAVYDNTFNQFEIFNKSEYLKAKSPGAAFNLMLAAIGLETGRLFNEAARVPGDSLGMDSALERGDEQYFRTLDSLLPLNTVKKWVDTVAYGNKNVGSDPRAPFWLNGTLVITPDEVLGLTERLYFKQLKFQPRTQEVIIHHSLNEEETGVYSLTYAGGLSTDSLAYPLAWVYGWEQENRHPYFFVLQIRGKGPGQDLRGVPVVLLKKILRSNGFFLGRK